MSTNNDNHIPLTLKNTAQRGTLTYRTRDGEIYKHEGWFKLCPENRYVKFRGVGSSIYFCLAYTHQVIEFYTHKEHK